MFQKKAVFRSLFVGLALQKPSIGHLPARRRNPAAPEAGAHGLNGGALEDLEVAVLVTLEMEAEVGLSLHVV